MFELVPPPAPHRLRSVFERACSGMPIRRSMVTRPWCR